MLMFSFDVPFFLRLVKLVIRRNVEQKRNKSLAKIKITVILFLCYHIPCTCSYKYIALLNVCVSR